METRLSMHDERASRSPRAPVSSPYLMATLPSNAMLNTTFAELFSMLLPETGLRLLRTHPDEGLTETEAFSRSSLCGPNAISKTEKESVWNKILEQINNPLILLLLASAAVSLLLGHIDDAVSIALAVLIVSTGELRRPMNFHFKEANRMNNPWIG